MILGDRLRDIRLARQLSPRDIEVRTGLQPSYVLRVESGHTIPSIESLEKWAEALGVPVCQLFYAGDQPPLLQNLRNRVSADDIVLGRHGKGFRQLGKAH